MKSTMRKILRKSGLLFSFGMLSIIFLTTGCLKDSNDPPKPTSLVSIYHAVPNGGSLDIRMEDGIAVTNRPLEYEDYTIYINFYSGTRDFTFTDGEDKENIILESTYKLEENHFYSLFVVNYAELAETVLVTDTAEAPEANKAMVRLINLCPDSSPVDLLADENSWFSNVAFKDGVAFVELDAGTYDFEFVSHADNNDVLLTVTNAEIKKDQYHTIILKGFITPPVGNTNEISMDIVNN